MRLGDLRQSRKNPVETAVLRHSGIDTRSADGLVEHRLHVSSDFDELNDIFSSRMRGVLFFELFQNCDLSERRFRKLWIVEEIDLFHGHRLARFAVFSLLESC